MNDGTLHLTAAAAKVAARIQVNGGVVHVGEPPAGLLNHTENPSESCPGGTLLALPAGKPADNTGTVPFLRRAQ